jgi:hypothetical protein
LKNLLRHQNGRYYARLFRAGKEIWKSLDTSHYAVAEARLGNERQKHRAAKEVDPSNAKMTFGQAAELYAERVNNDVNQA